MSFQTQQIALTDSILSLMSALGGDSAHQTLPSELNLSLN